MNYVIEGFGVLVNEGGEEHSLKARDFAWLIPTRSMYRNKEDVPFKMI